MSEPPAPRVPTDRLGEGWERTDETVETVFELPTMRVTGRTLLYEDEDLRERVRAATGADSVTRFLFATRLSFSPSLGPGGDVMVRPQVVSEARRTFADDLRDRGFESIERGRRQRMRTENRARASLTSYHATFPVDGTALPIEGWLAVWNDEGFRIAGGAYPRTVDDLGVDVDAAGFRDELLDALRAVE